MSHLLRFRLKNKFFGLNYILNIIIFYTDSQLNNFLLKIYIKNRFLRSLDVFYKRDRTEQNALK
ncbi:protein of unknown function [Cardinium endosymbiont cEper1 of Encarsia pergandiella]|nr:protein of unknown function [Cardinium endosymbiont cEper1 of Encarsia pergandiella]